MLGASLTVIDSGTMDKQEAAAKTDGIPIEHFIPLGTLLSAIGADHLLATDWTEITNILGTILVLANNIIRRLLNARWIRIFVKIIGNFATYRIFLLPNDVGRISVSRNHKGLRADLEQLLEVINISERAWNGEHFQHVENFCPWATAEPGSLFYIFNTLPSPQPEPSTIQDRFTRTAVQELLETSKPIAGLTTSLYPYQARAAAAMLQREASTELLLDPRFEKRMAADGKPYYLIPRELYFSKSPPTYQSNRCGILAETMGLGKTIICLAAILSTKHHIPPIPPEYIPDSPEGDSVPTLLDIAIRTAGRTGISAKAHFDRVKRESGYEYANCISFTDANPPIYYIPGVSPRTNRRTKTPPPKKMTICSGTIIVVPRNLVHQWQSEIRKHVSDSPEGLNVLILDAPSSIVPPVEQLRHYDVVVFSKPRFDREIRHGSDIFGRNAYNTFLECHCPYIGATRKRDCTCLSTTDMYHSPLQDLHWLRIIIDEGHEFSSSTSNSVLVAQKLVTAERRWIVSGTPARDKLFGVEVDIAVDTDEPELESGEIFANGIDDSNISAPLTPMSTDAPSLAAPSQSLMRFAALEKRKHFSLQEELGTSGASKSIGQLVNHFLQVRPWASAIGERHVEYWDDFIYRHENYRKRTHASFSGCFRRTLESLVIKTQPEDVEKDIILPLLTHKVIKLEPSYYDKLTANLFILFLTSNAVCSERTDQDYLFHKNSAKARYQLITNLRQSNFFWTGFSVENILSAIDTSKKYLGKPDIKCSNEDRALLSRCIEFAQLVLRCPGWQAMSRYHEIGLFLKDWPAESQSSWTLNKDLQPTILGASQLISAQDFVNGQISQEDPLKGLDGAGDIAMAKLKTDTQEESVQRQRQEHPQDSKVGVPTSAVQSEPLASKLRSTRTPKKSPKSVTKIAASTPTQITILSSDIEPNSDVTKNPSTPLSVKLLQKRRREQDNHELPAESQLRSTEIIGTVSAKLSYLLDRIIEFHDTEKIIVFYDGNNAAFYLAQCLDLLHIKYLIYAKSLGSEQKSRYIFSFDTDDSIRVLLMDIRAGAYGLNVNKASRVFFINPVCRPSAEAQAVKRAHRIGQTKPVHVETLVLKGTIEEAIFERSKNMTQTEHQEASQLSDDRGITHIIQTAQTLPLTDEEAVGAAQMAPLAHPLQVFGRKGRGDTRIRGIDLEADTFNGDIPRKRKRVSKTQASDVVKNLDGPTITPANPENQPWNHDSENSSTVPPPANNELYQRLETLQAEIPSIFG